MWKKWSAIACVALAAAAAEARADSIASGVWTPATGSPSPLIDGGPAVPLTTVASRGNFIVTATFTGTVTDAVFAYSLEFDAGVWYESGSAKYFSLDPFFMTFTPTGGGDTTVTATIPMMEFGFHPNLSGVDQQLHVWCGRPGVISVDPVLGVTGASATANYKAATSLPPQTIIPDYESTGSGISTIRPIELTILRDTDGVTDLPFALSFAGPTELLGALTLPTSAVIPAGDHFVTLSIPFNPIGVQNFPSTTSFLTVTATSSLGPVASQLKFAGMLSRDISGLSVGYILFPDDCTPTTVSGPQPPTTVKTSDCGDCVALSVPVTCLYGMNSSGDFLWYTQYKCSWFGSCTVTTSTWPRAGCTVSVTTQSCTPHGGIPQLLVPATVGPFVATSGHKCCYSISPSTTVHAFVLPDCF